MIDQLVVLECVTLAVSRRIFLGQGQTSAGQGSYCLIIIFPKPKVFFDFQLIEWLFYCSAIQLCCFSTDTPPRIPQSFPPMTFESHANQNTAPRLRSLPD